MVSEEAPTPEVCATCRFWNPRCRDEKTRDEISHGWCQRYPPTVMKPHVHDRARVWGDDNEMWHACRNPLTCFDDWCGEWRLLREKEDDLHDSESLIPEETEQ